MCIFEKCGIFAALLGGACRILAGAGPNLRARGLPASRPAPMGPKPGAASATVCQRHADEPYGAHAIRPDLDQPKKAAFGIETAIAARGTVRRGGNAPVRQVPGG